MDEYDSLSHSKWECKYHVVFIPKCRRKTLYAELRKHLGGVSQAGAAEGKPNRRGALDAGPRSHDDFDPSEICGLSGYWFYKG